MNDEALAESRVFSVGFRKALLLGCDRNLFLTLSLICFLGLYAWNFSPGAFLFYGVVYSVFFVGMRIMAKTDPLMVDVVLTNFIRYRKFYFAKATPFCTFSKKYKDFFGK